MGFGQLVGIGQQSWVYLQNRNPPTLVHKYRSVLNADNYVRDVMQLVWPGEDLTKHRHARRARSLPPVTFTRCRCSTLEPVASARLPLDGDDVTYFETYDSK